MLAELQNRGDEVNTSGKKDLSRILLVRGSCKTLSIFAIGTCSVADDFFDVCPDDATTSCGRSGR